MCGCTSKSQHDARDYALYKKLSSVDFSFACLKNVIFSRANLCRSKFQEVDTENTIFHDATMSE
ncbi:putative pentapeptide [Helianthus annuus]|nr:putative pentapeptide [Helianthus annuus]